MNQLIYQNQIIQDDWCFLSQGEQSFNAAKQVMRARDFFDLAVEVPDFSFGLVLETVKDFEDLKQTFHPLPNNLQLIVCQFKAFKNGFFYSIANILRLEMKYTKQLRASGDLYFDHLDYLIRSGFDAFDFAEFNQPNKLEAAKDWIDQQAKSAHYFDQYFQTVHVNDH